MDRIDDVARCCICPRKGCTPVKPFYSAANMRRHFNKVHYDGTTGSLEEFYLNYSQHIKDVDPLRCFPSQHPKPHAENAPGHGRISAKNAVQLEAGQVRVKYESRVYENGREFYTASINNSKVLVTRYTSLENKLRHLTNSVLNAVLRYDAVVSASMEAVECPYLDDVSLVDRGLFPGAPENAYTVRRTANGTLSILKDDEGVADLSIAVACVVAAMEHAHQRGFVLGGLSSDMVYRSDTDATCWFVRCTPLATAVPALKPEYDVELRQTLVKSEPEGLEPTWFLEKQFMPPSIVRGLQREDKKATMKEQEVPKEHWTPADDLYSLGVTIAVTLQRILVVLQREWPVTSEVAGPEMGSAIAMLRTRVEAAAKGRACASTALYLMELAVELTAVNAEGKATADLAATAAKFKDTKKVHVTWPGSEPVTVPVLPRDSVLVLAHRFAALASRRVGAVLPSTVAFTLGTRTLAPSETLGGLERELNEAQWRVSGASKKADATTTTAQKAAPPRTTVSDSGRLTMTYEFEPHGEATPYEVVCRVALELVHVKNPLFISVKGHDGNPLDTRSLRGDKTVVVAVKLRRFTQDSLEMDRFRIDRAPFSTKLPLQLFRGSVTLPDDDVLQCIVQPALSRNAAIAALALVRDRLMPTLNVVLPVAIMGESSDDASATIGLCYLPGFSAAQELLLDGQVLARAIGALASAVEHFHLYGLVHGAVATSWFLGREHRDQAEPIPYLVVDPTTIKPCPMDATARDAAIKRDKEDFAKAAEELTKRVRTLSNGVRDTAMRVIHAVRDGKLPLEQVSDALGQESAEKDTQ
jgi:hypothetical protein